MRTEDALELLRKSPNSFLLAYQIAYRARWKQSLNIDNLQPGEAMLGDHKNCGLSAREYRTARKNLAKWQIATFRRTNRGTIGRLMDTRLFSVLNEPSDQQSGNQGTIRRQSNDNQATTNYNVQTDKKEQKGKGPPSTASQALNTAERIALENRAQFLKESLHRAKNEASEDAFGAIDGQDREKIRSLSRQLKDAQRLLYGQ
jgi:hypothetical protein